MLKYIIRLFREEYESAMKKYEGKRSPRQSSNEKVKSIEKDNPELER